MLMKGHCMLLKVCGPMCSTIKWGPQQGSYQTPSNYQSSQEAIYPTDPGEKPTLFNTTKEVLDRLPQPRETLPLLGLDVKLIQLHVCIPVYGRLAQSVCNWHCLTRDP